MIQAPEAGGKFEYVKDVRDADRGEMNFEQTKKVLDGITPTEELSIDVGALVLFRGRNSMHRVTPTVGDRTRMLVVLAYNTKPSSSMTFPGNLPQTTAGKTAESIRIPTLKLGADQKNLR